MVVVALDVVDDDVAVFIITMSRDRVDAIDSPSS